MTTTTSDGWAVDYCPQCCPAGGQADRPVRLAAMTAPYAVTAGRGRRALCKQVPLRELRAHLAARRPVDG